MRKLEAKEMICRAFREWCRSGGITDPRGNDGFLVYLKLKSARSGLLGFRDTEDKWQTVHGWLRSARLVSD